MKTVIISGFLLTIIATVTAFATGVSALTQFLVVAGIIMWLGGSFVYIKIKENN